MKQDFQVVVAIRCEWNDEVLSEKVVQGILRQLMEPTPRIDTVEQTYRCFHVCGWTITVDGEETP